MLIGLVVGLIAAALVGLFVVAPRALQRQPGALEQWYGGNAVNIVARMNGVSGTNPVGSNPRTLDTGRMAYTGSCAECHGARGDGKGVFGQSTFPPATDLTTADVKGKSDGELFWIVKNGLGFTAMPGYASQYSDNDIWALVSYVRSLQGRQQPAQLPPTRAASS